MLYLLLIIVLIVVAVGVMLYNSLKKFQAKAEEAKKDLLEILNARHEEIGKLNDLNGADLGSIKSTSTEASTTEDFAIRAEKEMSLSGNLAPALESPEASPLKELEEKIQNAIRYYNSTASDLNKTLKTTPNNYVAGPLGFKEMAYFGEAPAQDIEIKTEGETHDLPEINTPISSPNPESPMTDDTTPAVPAVEPEVTPEAPAVEPVAAEPEVEAAPEVTAEPTVEAEPAVEAPVAEPVVEEAAPEVTPEPTVEAEPEVTPEPTVEAPAAEPAVEATPEVTPEPAVEAPAAEPTEETPPQA